MIGDIEDAIANAVINALTNNARKHLSASQGATTQTEVHGVSIRVSTAESAVQARAAHISFTVADELREMVVRKQHRS